MQSPPHLETNAPQHQHVSVTYGDGEHSFWLKTSTTFAELAAFVSSLDQLHHDVPIAISVTRNASHQRISTERVH